MYNICKNCGNKIQVSIFKGGDWCSENCRKALLLREARRVAQGRKCEYEMVWTDEVGTIPVCTIHGNNSKYPPSRGEHRPCLSVEPY